MESVTSNESLKKLLEKITKLEETNTLLIEKLEEIQKTSNRMEEHINFIENTYNKVKTPFHYLMDKINVLSFSPFSYNKETTETPKTVETNSS